MRIFLYHWLFLTLLEVILIKTRVICIKTANRWPFLCYKRKSTSFCRKMSIFVFVEHYRCYFRFLQSIMYIRPHPFGCVRMHMVSLSFLGVLFFVRMRDSNYVFLVYMVFLKLCIYKTLVLFQLFHYFQLRHSHKSSKG